ncbi:MAG: C40 family peptidase, partial [Lachnospiraceae bacterium]|nr:C40 family peptidase [Lachnospiraceae bacterium]
AEEEAKRKAEEAAAKKKAQEESRNSEESESSDDSDDSDDSDSDSGSHSESRPSGTSVRASGSGTGADIANYALQFVGCPYVAGGTSLTNGCDCSGFTQGVYSHFGISIPRSSYAQSAGGDEVSFDQAQAGDIIYYGGHVGIYIGNNMIVHASTAATGIKISSAFYRSIITIRRYY